MFLGEQHEVSIKVERRDHRGRVGRVADHRGDRFGDRMNDRALERGEEFRPRLRRHGTDDAAGHQEPEGVDRIGGIGHEQHVARRGDRLRHIGEAFL